MRRRIRKENWGRKSEVKTKYKDSEENITFMVIFLNEN